MEKKIITGSDFSGVGAFDQALIRLGIEQEKLFACDMDKFARQTYIYNFGEPDYYPENVYSREIPEKSLDIYMTSPPCQSFSLAGKRQGENSDKGILFYNSHEFIKKNKPRYFIFENVKGLLSDNEGKTFQRWIDYLGGKSVNGNPVIFPHEESTPYHVYYRVLNSKEHGVPQNRERIFIIGIRDNEDNNFSFPMPIPLKKRLKDILEPVVDEKYFLSDKMIDGLLATNNKHESKGNGFKFECKKLEDIANSITTKAGQRGTDNFISDEIIQINDPVHSNDRIYSDEGISPTLNTMQGGNRQPFVHVSEPNVINPLKDKTEYGWHFEQNVYDENGITRALKASDGSGNRLKVIVDEEYKIGDIRGRNPENPKSIKSGLQTVQMLEINENGVSNALTKVQKDNVLVSKQKIRRLTPTECFRLMDFNDDFKWNVSDSQAYKQAGNSIVVSCLVEIIKKLKL